MADADAQGCRGLSEGEGTRIQGWGLSTGSGGERGGGVAGGGVGCQCGGVGAGEQTTVAVCGKGISIVSGRSQCGEVEGGGQGGEGGVPLRRVGDRRGEWRHLLCLKRCSKAQSGTPVYCLYGQLLGHCWLQTPDES